MQYRALALIAVLLPAAALAQDKTPIIEVVVEPTVRLTKNWIFVVDSSDSMNGVFHKAIEGWRYIVQEPTDDWKFAVIVFNNTGQERWLYVKEGETKTRWLAASPDMFELAENWVESPKHRGVNSRGRRALDMALRTNCKDLSVVLITDGGFTSACENRGFNEIDETIVNAQVWRKLKGLDRIGEAVITTIGIRNTHYSAWCMRCVRGDRAKSCHDYSIPDYWKSNKGKKPSDADCQAFLQRIGTVYRGGYLLVSHLGEPTPAKRVDPHAPPLRRPELSPRPPTVISSPDR